MKLKQLLLIDLCARLPYGVECQFTWRFYNETTPPEGAIAKHTDKIKCININTQEVLCEYYDEWVYIKNCKPYLRPMSSMTEEEVKEFAALESIDVLGGDIKITSVKLSVDAIDWLNSHHFDYRGLIEKRLALKAPEGMYDK